MKDLSGFKSDLQSKGLSERSAATYTEALKYYLAYLATHGEEKNDLNISVVMSYLGYCRLKGNGEKTIGLRLSAIKKYAVYEGGDRMIEQLKLVSRGRTLPQALLTREELKMIYQSYPGSQLRKKVLLGLIVFQALRKRELLYLKSEDIDLEKATLRIKRGRKTEGRLLALQGEQLVSLQKYLKAEKQELVFGSAQLNPTLWTLTLQLRKADLCFKNYHQLRGSVISEWIRKNGLRKAQYLAGHRYVSSTERYQATHLEELQKALDRYHPQQEKGW